MQASTVVITVVTTPVNSHIAHLSGLGTQIVCNICLETRCVGVELQGLRTEH